MDKVCITPIKIPFLYPIKLFSGVPRSPFIVRHVNRVRNGRARETRCGRRGSRRRTERNTKWTHLKFERYLLCSKFICLFQTWKKTENKLRSYHLKFKHLVTTRVSSTINYFNTAIPNCIIITGRVL